MADDIVTRALRRHGYRFNPNGPQPRGFGHLGDLPEDLARERLSEPPILNDRRKPHPSDDLETQYKHGQSLNNYLAIVSTVNVLLFPFNPERAYLILVNTGATTVFLGMNRDADVTTGLPLPAGGGFFEPILGCINSISAIAAAGINNVIVVEGFYNNATRKNF